MKKHFYQPDNGNREITISVTENPSYFSRWYYFLLTAGSLSKEIRVSQLGKPYLEVEQPYYEVVATPNPRAFPHLRIPIYVYEAVNIEVKSDSEWIHWGGGDIVPVGNKVRYRMDFSILKNLSPTPREAIITFTQGSLSKTVTVRQAGAE